MFGYKCQVVFFLSAELELFGKGAGGMACVYLQVYDARQES